ncbi:MAG: LptA/OstA family protein [Candidatus Tectomicrobia bacterium]|nr:LptA/OstA family protein [Candidatus Tectomicrobia bacterium]
MMGSISRRVAYLSLIGLALLCLGANGKKPQRAQPFGVQAPVQDCKGPGQELDVTADQMTFDSKTHTFVFENNVHVRRCDMTLECDRLRVMNDAQGNRVERIVATGNVRMQQGGRRVQAERADYFDTEQKLVLTGEPRAWDPVEKNELTGDEMVLYLATEKLVVKRARVLFHPRQSTSASPSAAASPKQ